MQRSKDGGDPSLNRYIYITASASVDHRTLRKRRKKDFKIQNARKSAVNVSPLIFSFYLFFSYTIQYNTIQYNTIQYKTTTASPPSTPPSPPPSLLYPRFNASPFPFRKWQVSQEYQLNTAVARCSKILIITNPHNQGWMRQSSRRERIPRTGKRVRYSHSHC